MKKHVNVIAAACVGALLALSVALAVKIVKDNAPIVDADFEVYGFDYDGHDYIVFEQGGWRSVVHNPDCHCGE